MNIIISLILFTLPAYFANAVPVLLGGGTYLDFGKNFSDGERIFGNGKTIRGFFAGVAAGTLISGLLALYSPLEFFQSENAQFLAGFGLSFGTMIGDTLGSFLKRRIRLKPGKPFFPDSLIFLAMALVFAYPFTTQGFYTIFNVGFIAILTVVLHPLSNFIANKVGLKKVPW